MKKNDKRNLTSITDTEYNSLLHKIAVYEGIQLPETPEEMNHFEEIFADEIRTANLYRPSLDSILQTAKRVKGNKAFVFTPIEEAAVNPTYAMAARNGRDITPETESLMEQILQKAKEKRKDGN
jgi:hypothetical protein